MSKAGKVLPDFQAHLPRTGHNLGHDFGFTSTVGQLVPLFHTIMNPGEKITLGLDFDLRTMPLQQAAMTEIDTHVEYFFVPMQLIYEPFGSTIYNINDNYSSNFAAPGIGDRFPLLNVLTAQQTLTTSRASYPFGSNITDCFARSVFRLCDHLGLNPFMCVPTKADPSDPDAPLVANFFPYQLLAYQCIYQYMYRQDDREKFDASVFNWDNQYNNTIANLTTQQILDLFTLRYRSLNSDYFADKVASPIVTILNLNNTSNTVPLADSWLTRDKLGSTNVMAPASTGSSSSVPASQYNLSNYALTQFGLSYAQPAGTSASMPDVNTANIRAMFANEKLWSITGRAAKHYDDQTLAHFGFKVPHDVKHQVTKFGHDHSVIKIGEVISTAATSDAPLGEIAGKGYGAQKNQRHSFTAPCHGVVMMIWSVTPRYRYVPGFMKHNAVTKRFDLYFNEFDHLGMQPMFTYEFLNYQREGQFPTTQRGWHFRYEQWKRRYDRVSRAFDSTSGTLNSWMLGKYPTITGAPSVSTNWFASNIYKPADLNQIFLSQYDVTWNANLESYPASVYDNDPFVVDSHVVANLISTMSAYSLPRLDD